MLCVIIVRKIQMNYQKFLSGKFVIINCIQFHICKKYIKMFHYSCHTCELYIHNTKQIIDRFFCLQNLYSAEYATYLQKLFRMIYLLLTFLGCLLIDPHA